MKKDHPFWKNQTIIRNCLPEFVTIILMNSLKLPTIEALKICWIFLFSAFLIRLVYNGVIFLHGLGHVLFSAAFDKNPALISLANILENRSLAEISQSLIPFNYIFIPLINNKLCPWVEVGNIKSKSMRLKAAGGLLFNLTALIIGCFLSGKFNNYFEKVYENTVIYLSKISLEALITFNILILLSSWTDIKSMITGKAAYFYCGNFGFLGHRKGNEEHQELLPKRVVGIFKTMGQETEIRGEQAGGGLTLSRNKDDQIFLVGKKIVNRKRGNLTKSLESTFASVRNKAIKTGLKPLETIIGVWHYRYGTSGPPSVLETHWHQWMSAKVKTVWQIENDQWVSREKNVNHCITHNGDFEGWKLHGQLVDPIKLGLWLERVLHTPNNTVGDSPKIAGMLDLLMTQGMWSASVRLAYQLILSCFTDAFGGGEPSKRAPNNAPSELNLKKWSEIFSKVFSRQTKLLHKGQTIFSPESKSCLAREIFQVFSQDSQFANYKKETLSAFIEMTIQSFLENDLYQATKLFMANASGSFGLVTVSTLEEKKIVLTSVTQPMAIGFNQGEDYVVYASEPTAVDAILSRLPHTYRLDLNPKAGEIALLGVNDLTIYSMATKCELTTEEIQARLICLKDHPYIQITARRTKDPVESDLQEIPQVLRNIEDSWINPLSINRKTAEYLFDLLLKAKSRQYVAESTNIEFLITGMENSFWVGERFAEDLKNIFPYLSVKCISANKVLRMLQQDFQSLKLVQESIVLVITQSGQTYSTLQALNIFDSLVSKGTINEVFILTGEPSNFLSSPLSESRILINGSGRRTAEPSTITVVAAHQTLTELLLYLAKQMRLTFPSGSPLGMTLSWDSILVLEQIKEEFLYKSVPEIMGSKDLGLKFKSLLNHQLIKSGQKWALNITETPLAWSIQALYVLISLGWMIPFGYTLPLVKTIVNGLLWAFSLQDEVFLVGLINPWVTLGDIVIYIFGSWFWVMGLRYFQGRQLLARTGKRTLVIGDISWVHHLLESYVSKLFSLSYGIASIEVHSANPQDELLHHFGHRVHRGVLLFLGLPNDQSDQQQNAVLMTAKQANGIQNLGVGPDIMLVGHNPAIASLEFSKSIILSGRSNSFSQTQQKTVIEKLREGRFSSFERLLASYVFFWALAKKVASFPFLKYQHWKSQSRTKIMTTAAPISAFNFEHSLALNSTTRN